MYMTTKEPLPMQVLHYRADIDEEYQGWILIFTTITCVWLFCLPCYCAGMSSPRARKFASWMSQRLPAFYFCMFFFNVALMYLVIEWLPDWTFPMYVGVLVKSFGWLAGHALKWATSLAMIIAFCFVVDCKPLYRLLTFFGLHARSRCSEIPRTAMAHRLALLLVVSVGAEVLEINPWAPEDAAMLPPSRHTSTLNRLLFSGNARTAMGGGAEQWMVAFCASWWEPCEELHVIFEQLAAKWQGKLNTQDRDFIAKVRFATVDCATDKVLCNEEQEILGESSKSGPVRSASDADYTVDMVLLALALCIVLRLLVAFKERIALTLGLDHKQIFNCKMRDCLSCFTANRFRPIELLIWKVEDLPSSDIFHANNVFIEAYLGYNETMRTRVHNNAGSDCILKESVQLNFDELILCRSQAVGCGSILSQSFGAGCLDGERDGKSQELQGYFVPICSLFFDFLVRIAGNIQVDVSKSSPQILTGTAQVIRKTCICRFCWFKEAYPGLVWRSP
eukprot:s428_g22.t1